MRVNRKIVFAIIFLVLAGSLIAYKYNMKVSTNEGWWGIPSRTVLANRIVQNTTTGKISDIKNKHQSMMGHNKFVHTPSFQSDLSPRFSNVDLGANIRYNLPSEKNLASPCNPLSMGNMATENYSEDFCPSKCNGGPAKCGKGGVSLDSNVMNDDMISENVQFKSAMDKIYGDDSHDSKVAIENDLIPVGDMTALNSEGETEQFKVYDRYMYSTKSSRLASQGCQLRGDLPIVPCQPTGWFNVHPEPSRDLSTGAMNVMGGFDNETSRAMSELVNVTSGGYDNTVGGMDLNMSSQFDSSTTLGGAQLNVTAFP